MDLSVANMVVVLVHFRLVNMFRTACISLSSVLLTRFLFLIKTISVF